MLTIEGVSPRSIALRWDRSAPHQTPWRRRDSWHRWRHRPVWTGAGEQDVDGFHGSFPYVSPRQRGKSIIYIENQYSISKVPLPLKRFFWPKYCQKGQKQQPKAVFKALGCCFSQVFQAVSGSGEQFTNRGTLCLSRRCEHPMQGICSRIHGRLPDRYNTYSIPHRFLRSYGCRVPGRVRPRIR